MNYYVVWNQIYLHEAPQQLHLNEDLKPQNASFYRFMFVSACLILASANRKWVQLHSKANGFPMIISVCLLHPAPRLILINYCAYLQISLIEAMKVEHKIKLKQIKLQSARKDCSACPLIKLN